MLFFTLNLDRKVGIDVIFYFESRQKGCYSAVYVLPKF